MTTIVDGNLGISYPVTAGSTSATQASSSKILQVVSGTLASIVTTTSGSFVTTGLTVSITPSSTSSRIYVSVSSNCDTSSTGALGTQASFTIYRNSSNLYAGGMTQVYSSGRVIAPLCMTYLDSPATTSATTYTAYFLSNNGATVAFNNASGSGTPISTITAWEIAQ